MKKITATLNFITFLGLFLALSPLLAQPPALPEPRQPLPSRAPAISSWTVTFTYSDAEKTSKPDAATYYRGDLVQSIVVSKSRDTYREQIQLLSGKQYERWDFGGTQFGNSSKDSSVFVILPPSEQSPDLDYYDHRRSDFPELSWISLKNFRGEQTYYGKQVFRFETDQDGKKLTALLSTEDQMPVLLSDGTATRLYKFNPSATNTLVPPPDFQAAFNRHKAAMKSLKYHPGLP